MSCQRLERSVAMTMILSLGNRDHLIQLSDRRLTAGCKICDEECGKSGVMFLADGRFSFGFTGIARTLGLEMRKWLLKALSDSALPDYQAYNTLKRFEAKATDLFKNHPNLANISPSDKRLTILFSGYLYFHNPPMLVCSLISNFQNPALNKSSPIACDSFFSSFTSEKKPRTDKISWVQRVGAWQAMNPEDIDSIRNLLVQRKPHKAIIEKATNIMLQMADNPKSKGTIGKQLNWIAIPADPSKEVEVGYYSDFLTHTIWSPCVVVATGDNCHMSWDEPMIEAVNPKDTPFMAVRKVRKNAPCPCGSGKKYKKCHGSDKLQTQSIKFIVRPY